MPSTGCPVALRHQPRMMFPFANHWGNPCSPEMANTSSADRSVRGADLAPSMAQSPNQAWYNAKATLYGESRRASASASSRHIRACWT
jgi:hypothetical protein